MTLSLKNKATKRTSKVKRTNKIKRSSKVKRTSKVKRASKVKRTSKKQYGGDLNATQQMDIKTQLKKISFDDEVIENMMLNINTCAHILFKKRNHYTVFIKKLTEFADADESKERKQNITVQLINKVLVICDRDDPFTDTETDD